MAVPEFHLFLPQMRLSFDAIVERAQAAEAHGFTGIAFMDHLAPPMAEDQDMWEAMTVAGWVLARTESLIVSHLVLCDPLRHPAVLARQVVSLDHASGGRFELGIGWGSVPAELETFGLGPTGAVDRVERLGETLEVLQALWSGERVRWSGRHLEVVDGLQRPVPTRRIPIVIGGAGPKTMELVAAHADWWNLPIYALERLDELRPSAGDARVSTQEMVAFVPSEAQREEVTALTARRFGGMGRCTVGTADELVAHFAARRARGVERFYVWFTDFAPPSTLEAFGRGVIGAM
jgi:alkanesulfonate monooxygenase SsuD/methylene tetrahydromethanopterin reductase-like flavin-dependent oxidoreductase (luciferase family)